MVRSREEKETDHFVVMGLTPNATEAEIRKAYRKLSLALHPDKNRNMDAELAASRFHEMQVAYEVLMNPVARLAAAEKLKAEEARKERRGAYDVKRKDMAEELERREEEERMKRFKGAQEAQRQQASLEKLKEETRKMREERERQKVAVRMKKEQEESQRQDTPPPLEELPAFDKPEIGPLDLTVRLTFPYDQFINLTTSQASKITGTAAALDTPLGKGLEAQFGGLDSLIWKAPKSEKKRKEVVAHATFKSLDSAFAAVKAGSQMRAGGSGPAEALEDVWIGWAAGSQGVRNAEDGTMSGEPARITWMRKQGMLRSTVDRSAKERSTPPPESDILQKMKGFNQEKSHVEIKETPSNNPFPTFSFTTSSSNQTPHTSKTNNGKTQSTDDFESSILQKMREAERKRAEEAIRQIDERSM